MKPSEIARYWAARELTRIERRPDRVELTAPFACPAFTIRTAANPEAVPRLDAQGGPVPLREVMRPAQLEPGTWLRVGRGRDPLLRPAQGTLDDPRVRYIPAGPAMRPMRLLVVDDEPDSALALARLLRS